MKRPNLFYHATKELSQDAFLCYVFSYFNEEYKNSYPKEYEFSKFFIKDIFKRLNINIEPKKLEIKRQHLNIDVLLIVNDLIYIIIEDKIHATEGDKQIEKYKEKIFNEYKVNKENIYSLYYKTGDESYNSLKYKKKEYNNNFAYMMREDIISIFENYTGDNIIILDYIENLKSMEEERNNFRNIDLRKEKLSWNEIVGLYNQLDKEFYPLKENGNFPKDSNGEENFFDWEYVSNPSGGFYSYFFYEGLMYEKYHFYPQIEANENYFRLVIKLNPWSKPEEFQELKKQFDLNKLYRCLEILKKYFGNSIEKPKSFRPKSATMTVGVFNDWLVLDDNGHINTKETALNINEKFKTLISLKGELKDLI